MSGRTVAVLVLALLSGLAAMFGANQMMHRGGTSVAQIEVLTAARDLQVEEILQPDLVKVVKMPRSQVPAGSFSSFKDVKDRWVRIPLLTGEVILDAKLAARDLPVGLMARIPSGMRAVAVEVNEQSGVSGFVLPDHRVDVILARNRHDSDSAPESETILQDVQVLAAGTTITRPEDKSIQVRTVTLAVTPEQVDRLVAARTEGTLSLALRGHNDHQIQPPRPALSPTRAPAVPSAPVEKPLPTALMALDQMARTDAAVVEPPRPPARKIVIWHGPADEPEQILIGEGPVELATASTRATPARRGPGRPGPALASVRGGPTTPVTLPARSP